MKKLFFLYFFSALSISSYSQNFAQDLIGEYNTIMFRSTSGFSNSDTTENVIVRIEAIDHSDTSVLIFLDASDTTESRIVYLETNNRFNSGGFQKVAGTFFPPDSVDMFQNIAGGVFDNYQGVKITGNNITENTLAAVTVYPNPAKEMVYISGARDGAFTASVYTLNGQVQRVTQQSNTLKVGTLAPGIYLLALEKGMHRKVLRFVKE